MRKETNINYVFVGNVLPRTVVSGHRGFWQFLGETLVVVEMNRECCQKPFYALATRRIQKITVKIPEFGHYRIIGYLAGIFGFFLFIG
jgi:hypothetical protein